MDPVKKKPTEVEIETKEPVAKKGVEIDLDPKPKEETPEPKFLSAEEAAKLHSRIEYLNRKQEKTLQQIQEMMENFKGRQDVPAIEEVADPEDEIDKLAEKDWKKAVDALADKRIKQALEEREAIQAEERQKYMHALAVNKSSQRVLKEFPEIADNGTEICELYAEALELEKQDDPSVLGNTRGPEIVRDRMKELARERGISLKRDKEEIDSKVEEELKRRTRAQATAGAGRPAPSGKGGTVSLTDDEIALAERLNVPLEQIAKFKVKGEKAFREGVSVS